MSEFILETNVTKPKPNRARSGRTPVYPFQLMKIGNSFKVTYDTDNKDERKKIDRKVRTAILTFRKRDTEGTSRLFSTVSVNGAEEKDGKDGLRVFCEPAKTKTSHASA